MGRGLQLVFCGMLKGKLFCLSPALFYLGRDVSRVQIALIKTALGGPSLTAADPVKLKPGDGMYHCAKHFSLLIRDTKKHQEEGF